MAPAQPFQVNALAFGAVDDAAVSSRFAFDRGAVVASSVESPALVEWPYRILSPKWDK